MPAERYRHQNLSPARGVQAPATAHTPRERFTEGHSAGHHACEAEGYLQSGEGPPEAA
jgi:hypothetical protein